MTSVELLGGCSKGGGGPRLGGFAPFQVEVRVDASTRRDQAAATMKSIVPFERAIKKGRVPRAPSPFRSVQLTSGRGESSACRSLRPGSDGVLERKPESAAEPGVEAETSVVYGRLATSPRQRAPVAPRRVPRVSSRLASELKHPSARSLMSPFRAAFACGDSPSVGHS